MTITVKEKFKEVIGREPSKDEELKIQTWMRIDKIDADDPMFAIMLIVFDAKELQRKSRLYLPKAIKELDNKAKALVEANAKAEVQKLVEKASEEITFNVSEVIKEELIELIERNYENGKKQTGRTDAMWLMFSIAIFCSTITAGLMFTAFKLYPTLIA